MRELVVASGKGGTGKTSLTAAFAFLAGENVLCDADVDAASPADAAIPDAAADGDAGADGDAVDARPPEKALRFGRAGDTATRTVTAEAWDTLTTGLPTTWLNVMFTSLTDDRSAGRVRGRQRGRLASPGRSLFDFSTATMGYVSTSAAGTNSGRGGSKRARARSLSRTTAMRAARTLSRARVVTRGVKPRRRAPTSATPATTRRAHRTGHGSSSTSTQWSPRAPAAASSATTRSTARCAT